MQKKWMIILIVVFALIVFGSAALAQGVFEHPWGWISAGSSESWGGDFTLQGTVLQPVDGITMAGGSYTLSPDGQKAENPGQISSINVFLPLITH